MRAGSRKRRVELSSVRAGTDWRNENLMYIKRDV